MTTSSLLSFLLLPVLAGLVWKIGSSVLRRTEPHSHAWLTIATTPALLQIVMFYSLAVHMHSTLHSWPSSIGEHGFPQSLAAHAKIVFDYFGGLMISMITLWPVALVLCLLICSWRRWVPYLAVYFLSFWICIAGMLLAPSQFLNWWWD